MSGVLDMEAALDSPDAAERRSALAGLASAAGRGEIELPPAGEGDRVNLHYHTFFSYNCEGWSPSKIAWLARREGLAVAGIVDFDVLDGVDEFLRAGRVLGLRCVAGIETRVCVPELAGRGINSPDEPGIAYHMGAGFPSGAPGGESVGFLESLRSTSRERNRELIDRVNGHLDPVRIDCDRDVLPLTPSGNATERHICLAYVRKAAETIGPGDALADYWMDRLGGDAGSLDLPDGPALQAALRAATMKRGGVGYARPGDGSFPGMAETNRFIVAAGGIPTYCWLDGSTDAESRPAELLETVTAIGGRAVNVVPDRNFTRGVKDDRVRNLHEFVGLADSMGLPVVAGTEMNAPGQRFVDDFEADELAPLLSVFVKGAHIVYGHSVMARRCGLGYCGEWSGERFASNESRNEFFERVGAAIGPGAESALDVFGAASGPDEILRAIGCGGGSE